MLRVNIKSYDMVYAENNILMLKITSSHLLTSTHILMQITVNATTFD